MEEIVQYIIQKLTNREKQTLTLSSKTNFSDANTNRRYYLEHKHIILTDVGVLALNQVLNKENNCQLTPFLYDALDYDCHVKLQLSFDYPDLIEKEVLLDSTFEIRNYQNKTYRSISRKFITYKDVALFDSSIILIIFKEQHITDLAKEQLEKNKVVYFERGKSK